MRKRWIYTEKCSIIQHGIVFLLFYLAAGEDENMVYDLQRASMWKRISAWMFDAILLGIVAVLFVWGLSAVLGLDGYQNTLDQAYERYSAQYGVNLQLSLTEYDALTSEEIDRLNEAYAAMSQDEKAVEAYNMIIQLILMTTSLGILLAHVIMEFVIPLAFGNGQTLGKKIFGTAVMQQDGVRITPRILFVRTVLGKYTLETMVPVLIAVMIWFGMLGLVGTLVLLGIGLVQLCMLIFTQNRMAIHDALCGTVSVDLASQLIFPDRDAMIAYKEKVHAEQAAREAY